MFFLLLVATLILASVHAFRLEERTAANAGHIFLLYVLVGYCGLPMLAVSIGILAAPERMAEMLPIGPTSPVVAFFGWAYLGMSLISVLALRYRGSFVAAPAICWTVYFAGATAVHLQGAGLHGSTSHAGVILTLATHGLVAVVLATALFLSRGILTSDRVAL